MTLTTHHLRFTAVATAPLELDQHSGAAIRGALTTALWDRFCTNKAAPTCVACPLVRVCPVAALVAPLREDDQPGSEQRPRPYVVRPPLDGARAYAPGDTLSFQFGLVGAAAQLFPYVVMATQLLEREGLGKRVAVNNHRRGTVQVREIASLHPLTTTVQPLYAAGKPTVQAPGLPVRPSDVALHAEQLPTDHITLHFKTPLRLIDNKHLVKRITLRPLIQRLMRRLDDLSIAYGDGPLGIDFRGLLELAEQVQTTEDQTRWVNLASYSSRQRTHTPIGGLMGQATFTGTIAPLRELLVWGSLIHVGKNAVKGDGWYEIIPSSASSP
ncbi:MAG: CRISPR system precrRNA processing endoribonuclease RAMP protein Cas6 [Chloroflexota bacterium]|nr:CRISPR system precrRNA processing endoribonuclease RAMP protein Cas6 [Chloroflexota bacterium]